MNHQLQKQLEEYVACFPYSFSIDRPEVDNRPDFKPILKEVQKTWEQYVQTPEGKIMVDSLETKDLNELRAALPLIADHPLIKKLIDWIRAQDFLAASFSIGIKLEAQLLLGVTGVLGYAVGVGTANGKESAEFLTLSINEGIELGAMIGIEFGIWTVSPGDMGGFSLCTEIDLDFEIGISEGTYYTTHSFLGETITIGVGAEAGISEMECYTFILGDQGDTGREPYLKPVIQEPKSNFLILENVKCVHPSNDGAGDENEVYFTFQADGGKKYPFPPYDYFSMKEGETWNTGRSVWFDDHIDIILYDEDGTSEDDELGKFKIELSQLSVGQSKVYHSTKDYSSTMDKVEYTIQARLVATNVDVAELG